MFSDVKCCTFILLLLISYSCVEARIISNSEYGENVNDESINSEILDNTVYENWYDYYDEALLEEYAGPVVVDLDKYMTGDDIHNNYDDYYTTVIFSHKFISSLTKNHALELTTYLYRFEDFKMCRF